MSRKHEWHTPRLIIREFRETDAAGLEELQTDPEACRFIGGAWPAGRAQQLLPKIVASYQTSDLEWFAVTRKEDGAFLGVCWLGPLGEKWRTALEIGPEIELGYRYARRAWGNGYATEAGEAMIRRGFEELNLPQIIAIVKPENVASDRVLNKLGMQYRKSAQHDGVTIKYYTLTREQFQTQ